MTSQPQFSEAHRTARIYDGSSECYRDHQRRQLGQNSAPYCVQFVSGSRKFFGNGDPEFVIHLADEREWENISHADAYSAALAFVNGKATITGDMVGAVRFYKSYSRPALHRLLLTAAALYTPTSLETWVQSRGRAAQNIRFHYDRSNEFYHQFLDSRMVYSCAYFGEGVSSLEEAQLSKLEHICHGFLET